MPYPYVERQFRAEVLRMLLGKELIRLFRAEVLRMLLAKKLITEATVEKLLPWRHSGFSVNDGVRVEDRQAAARPRSPSRWPTRRKRTLELIACLKR